MNGMGPGVMETLNLMQYYMIELRPIFKLLVLLFGWEAI